MVLTGWVSLTYPRNGTPINCGAGKVGALDLPLGAMGYLWIGLGSALGGMARYGCSVLALRFFGAAFPWGTLFVNVSGSLVIGFLAALAIADGRPLISPEARMFLLVGVCGGFTTFSAFSLETLELARNGEWLWASAYVALSVTLCLLAVWLGYIGASALGR